MTDVSIDNKDSVLDVGKRVSKAMNISNVRFVRGDVGKLPFKDESFDGLFSQEVLTYTDEKTSFQELSRVLKPGGKVYLCVNGTGWPLKIFFSGLSHGEFIESIYAILITKNTLEKRLFGRTLNRSTFFTVGEMKNRLADVSIQLTNVWTGMQDFEIERYFKKGDRVVYRTVSRGPVLGLPYLFQVVGVKK